MSSLERAEGRLDCWSHMSSSGILGRPVTYSNSFINQRQQTHAPLAGVKPTEGYGRAGEGVLAEVLIINLPVIMSPSLIGWGPHGA